MYRIRPTLYIRIRCEDEWSGTIQELYEVEAETFDSKDDLTKLLHEYASHEFFYDEIPAFIKSDGFRAINMATMPKQKSIACLVEIYASQRNTWQGIFRSEGVAICFRNGNELFALMEKAYSRKLFRKKKRVERNSAEITDKRYGADYVGL